MKPVHTSELIYRPMCITHRNCLYCNCGVWAYLQMCPIAVRAVKGWSVGEPSDHGMSWWLSTWWTGVSGLGSTGKLFVLRSSCDQKGCTQGGGTLCSWKGQPLKETHLLGCLASWGMLCSQRAPFTSWMSSALLSTYEHWPACEYFVCFTKNLSEAICFFVNRTTIQLT